MGPGGYSGESDNKVRQGVAAALGPVKSGPSFSAPHICDGVSANEQALGFAHQVLDVLEERLVNALTPRPPSVAETRNGGPSDRPEPARGMSHVTVRLGGLYEGLTALGLRIEDLIRRVEV